MKLILSLTLIATLHAAPSSAPPATLTKEGDLVMVKLTAKGEKSLRIKIAEITKRTITTTRLYSGEIVLPLSTNGTAIAPVVGGTLDERLRLANLQTAADGNILQAEAQLKLAATALTRAKNVLAAEAGSVRSVDEAKSAVAIAQAALETAQAQRDLLGSPVHQVNQATPTWLKVAISSGEADLLDAKAHVTVKALSATAKSFSATPIQGPATATPATNTLDWYFDLPSGTSFRPGQKLSVEIPTLASKEEKLVIPTNAILHDINGGQWVYEQTAPLTYTRRRIQVARFTGNLAVLATGPPVGSKIVTDGSAELFGTEFMTGK